MSLLDHDAWRDVFGFASRFREDFHSRLTRRGDTLFETTDAMVRENSPVTSPADLTLLTEHRRGHGALYDVLNCCRIAADLLRRVLAVLPQPKAADNRLVLAVDVSNWLRPGSPCSANRPFCHVYGRNGYSSDQFIPGWPYSFVAALETGRTSWCQLLDAVRLGPDDDLVVFDAGYDAPRMACLLDGLPVEVLGRMRSDQAMRKPVPTPWIPPPQGGRPPKHGKEFRLRFPRRSRPRCRASTVTQWNDHVATAIGAHRDRLTYFAALLSAWSLPGRRRLTPRHPLGVGPLTSLLVS